MHHLLHCFGVELDRHIRIAYGLLSYFHPILDVSAIWGSEAYQKHNAQHIHKAIHHRSRTSLTVTDAKV